MLVGNMWQHVATGDDRNLSGLERQAADGVHADFTGPVGVGRI